MSESERNRASEAVEKIIGNMTSEMQTVDGQYVPLGFTPPPTEPPNWNQQQNSYNYNLYASNPEIPVGFVPRQQFNPPFSYMPQPPQFDMNEYNKNLDTINNLKYNIYNSMPNGSPETVFGYDFNLLDSNVELNLPILETPTQSNHAHLIDNLVGNWMPNTSGTYSPFGEPFKPNPVFERESPIRQPLDDPLIMEPPEEKHFAFARTNRNNKPRIVAEIKPMRPSYSDVLTKPVPPTNIKPIKPDTKESKQKKDNKKSGKGEKAPKNSGLNRSNTNSEIKDLPGGEKTSTLNKTATDREKRPKTPQLNRKWASLDNINGGPMLVQSKGDDRKKKRDESPQNGKNSVGRSAKGKVAKGGDPGDGEAASNRVENHFVKNGVKKSKFSGRQKNSDVYNERPPGKRNQRTRKRENNVILGLVCSKLKQYLKSWWNISTVFLFWLIHLISDVCSLSLHISRDVASNLWIWLGAHWVLFLSAASAVLQRVRLLTWLWEKIKKTEKPVKEPKSFRQGGLPSNISMPTTGDEAMKRLLACKGKDPYSILGVTPACSDDDIKRYYKRQAFLVHPDKNQQPGAEEAFKILVHAFDMIGEPGRRAAYDKGVVESVQVEQAWSELTELLAQLQQKVEAAANTICCSACGLRHKRVKVDRPSYAARNCASCKIHHAAREGDIWAEARCFGFLWHYYACMEGGVYDITEWAGCQKDSLKHLRPDSHQVQYRIALGKQNNQPRRHSGSARTEKPPDLENLLNSLYGQTDSVPQGAKRRNKNKK